MWPFKKSAAKAQKSAQERDGYFRMIDNALCIPRDDKDAPIAEAGLNTAIFNLIDKHKHDPLTAPFLLATLDKMVKWDLDKALSTLIRLYAWVGKNGENIGGEEFYNGVTDISFNAMAFTSKENESQMATLAMLTQSIAETSSEGGLIEGRAISRWSQVFDVLSKSEKYSYGLAAACNAVAVPKSKKLVTVAADKWETAVLTLAQKDREKASNLVLSYHEKCKEFAEQGAPVWRSGALAKVILKL